MRHTTQLLLILSCMVAIVPPAIAEKTEHAPVPPKILQARSVYVDCVCPRGLAAARAAALQQLGVWGRFQISENKREADLIILFSGNPYLGDYNTRDGADTRNVSIRFTIMTVIDPMTGQSLWTDSREWGSMRVSGATKDLIKELREQMEGQTKRWSLNEILMCSVTPVYAGYAHLTPEDALAKSGPGSGQISGTPDQLMLSSPEAPAFCQRAQIVFGPGRRIVGFEVTASRADDMDIGEVLQRADSFDFTGGKTTAGERVYFSATSKDKKVVIQFTVEGRKSSLSRVSFFY